MIKEYPCNLCGSTRVLEQYPDTIGQNPGRGHSFACTNCGHGEHYRVVRCQECGLLFSSPRPDGNALEDEYQAVEDQSYVDDQTEGRSRAFEHNLDNLSRFKKNGDLLDVGCAIGIFLFRARARGWNVQGIEPSGWGVKRGRELFQLPLEQGTYKDLARFEKKFDAITMWDVLEHLDDPLAALKSCRVALKDDGVLAFSTVDSGSLYARVLGRRWPWLMMMHIFYFDRRTIRKYLEKAGFEILSIKAYQHVVSLKYLEYKLSSINGFLCCVIRVLRKVPLLSGACLPVAMGDFMEVYAKKIEGWGAADAG
ncbi:MAG: class I SAM-dependent methyltransferase [Candidatus Omnitrophica bacterium]|nr:class I SAM-dependent methyltransferase [Candidatus Omnitrophota bacterium]